MIQNWPEGDDRLVVAEMLSDTDSPHWEKCRAFIAKQLFKMKHPPGSEEDIVQQALLAIKKNLSHFRFDAQLTSWITLITNNKAKDALRAYKRQIEQVISIEASQEVEKESIRIDIATERTLEEEYLLREKLREAISGLQTFVTQQKKHDLRNARIVFLALLEDLPCDEVAQRLGVDRQVVYTVIRAARRHLREHLQEE